MSGVNINLNTQTCSGNDFFPADHLVLAENPASKIMEISRQ